MLKITFISPKRIIQDGFRQECMFVVCKYAVVINKKLYMNFGNSTSIVDLDSVSKIEPYKL